MAKRDDQILDGCLERYTIATTEWQDIRDQSAIDRRVLAGDIWDALAPEAKKQRKAAARPIIAPDEIGQYINQVVNEVRANPRTLKFAPTGNGANDKGARLYEDKAREINYRSHAVMHNTAAFENCVTGSYGFTGVETKYVHAQVFDPNQPPDVSLFNQDIWIRGFPNPDMVLPDPFAQAPDLSDMSHAFVLAWLPVKEFARKYGRDAKVVNFTQQNTAQAQDWFSKDLKQVLTAEYWTKDVVGTRKLWLLKDLRDPNAVPQAVYADMLPAKPKSDQIAGERDVDIYAVKQHFTNGVEILKTSDWPGKYIPIAGCLGKTIYVDDGAGAKRKLLSMTRLARDPFLSYCYVRCAQLERIGMAPLFPYFYPRGGLTPDALNLVAKSLHEPVAAIPYETSTPNTPPGTMLPPPSRNPDDAGAVIALEGYAEAMRRAIQAAMGISPLPTPMQRDNQKSGKAMQKLEESGQRGSFHFRDAHENMLRFQGVLVEDLLPKTLDTFRKTGMQEADGTASMKPVNDPSNPDTSLLGDYTVTVSTGPDFDSEREEASGFVDTIVQSIQMVAQIAGPKPAAAVLAKSIKLKNLGAIGDQIADIIEPPEYKQQDGQQADPMVLQKQLMQAKQMLEQTGQAAQKMHEEIQTGMQTKQMELASKEKIAQAEIASKERIAAADRETKITVAELGAKVDRLSLFLEERARIGLAGQDAAGTAADHAHDVRMALVDHTLQTQQANQAHQQALEQGDQATAGAIAQQANQAALAPAPEAGA